MNPVAFRPAKLLIAMVGKYSGELVLAAGKRGGAKGGTKAMGWSMARTSTGDDDVGEPITNSVIFIMMHDEADSVVREVIQASLEDPESFKGMAVVVDAAAMLRPGSMVRENAESARERAERERMEADNTLITAIITHGQADEIMRVARQAGARGGTILNARGTGTEDDVKFFGISLAPEKEMLLIVAEKRDAHAILEAVCKLSIFSAPGGGIVYTQKVEQFIVLGS